MSRAVASWGRVPDFPQTCHSVHWRSQLATQLRDVSTQFGSTLAFGQGLSYGDSCLAGSDHVLGLRGLDRFIAADWERGVLTAESGVTLAEVLAVAIPRGWFLPVTPGTKYVTLGGAVANDVHGKNHHVRGTFGCHVRRFGLLRSNCGEIVCSDAEQPDLYRATIAGLGLTGVITWVELQLVPIRSSAVRVQDIRFGTLDEFFALSRELDPKHEYAVSWIDCSARGRSLGRGLYSVGDHLTQGTARVSSRRALRFPFAPRRCLLGPTAVSTFNRLYFRRPRPRERVIEYEPYLYPLDGILQWNRLYGAAGFQQFQCVLPDASAREASGELLAAVAASGRASFLSVMKRCGDVRSPGLLSFPLPGITIALDFAQHPDLGRSLFPRLDSIVRAAGGRLYPAKDAHMQPEDFRHAYPQWEQVEDLRDPALSSRFWQRVTRA